LQSSNNYKKDCFVRLFKDASYVSAKAHELLFENLDNKHNETISAIYLNKAISLMSTAKSVYISNIEILESPEIDDIFVKFEEFESEFLENIETDHSHQWTDIHFNRFKEAFDLFAVNL